MALFVKKRDNLLKWINSDVMRGDVLILVVTVPNMNEDNGHVMRSKLIFLRSVGLNIPLNSKSKFEYNFHYVTSRRII